MELPQGDELIRMYKSILRIRRFEEKLYSLFLTGSMPGTMHQCIGQEAVYVGVCANLRREDYITTTHRSHGQYLAKGASAKELMAELFAKKTGCCKGMGGSMHISKPSMGILGTGGIVGAGIPIAVGVALSIRLRSTDQVVASFFGDGAINTGAFSEAANLAATWELPVLFVCENNFYAFSTPINEVTALQNLTQRAQGYGIYAEAVDGNDVLAVYKVASEGIQRAREGKPFFLECKTYRYKGHARFDPAHYRPDSELKEWLKKDPLSRLEDKLLELDVLSQQKMENIAKKVDAEIEDAIRFAQNSPDPDPDDSLKYVYA